MPTSAAGASAVPQEQPPGPRGFAPPVLLGEVGGSDVNESSGLAASRRNPGLIWTHNDSGDRPRLYCLTRTATTCGTWEVTGARALDWEDMAAGPGPAAGEPYLYVGDIGDNRAVRAEVVVYRLVEPQAPPSRPGLARTSPADRVVLRYDDGPHDAEALLVHPVSGDLYVITKDFGGGRVYKAAVGTSVLARIADFEIGFGEVVTGGDIAPDGKRVAVSTYGRGFELTLPAGARSFDAVWKVRPRPVELADRAQGESIAYRLDGQALITTSERSPFGIHEVVRR